MPLPSAPPFPPRLIVFDSGIGGLSVSNEIRKQLPTVEIIYVADNRIYPYGLQEESVLIKRVCQIMPTLESRFAPDAIVVACNSASTVVLEALRAQTRVPVIGVVPAIKPAAEQSLRKVIGLLATPGTVNRQYTQRLIDEFAPDCQVIRIGSNNLVSMAEQKLRGLPINDNDIHAVLNAFRDHDPEPDVIVLGCTHFPFLSTEIRAQLAPGTRLLDSSAAIARRTAHILAARMQTPSSAPVQHRFLFTEETPFARQLAPVLAEMGFAAPEFLHL